ncbi:MAG: HAD family hydrolase [Saprospiraceae bacterium]|nr:HAD family hydrolase [Saprospiraceae bacterium]
MNRLLEHTLLLFDVDGTLVYSGRRDSACFAKAYEQIYQKPFPSLDWRTFPHVTDHIIFGTCIQNHFQRAYTSEEEWRFKALYMEMLQAEREREPTAFRSVPGAVALMDSLRTRYDVQVAIATGGWREPARIKLRHVGIDPDQLVISGGNQMENREAIVKDAIRRIQQKNNRTIKRVVYIGDAAWDVTTSRNMNMGFVGIRHRGDVDVLKNLGASEVLQDFVSVSTFVESVLQAKPPFVKKI